MRVNIEVQCVCVPQHILRGIPFYTINLVKALARRSRNEYSITFFDQFKERGNRKYITEHIGAEALDNIGVFERNDMSFITIQNEGEQIYKTTTYNDITGVTADVFHYPHFQYIPFSLNGNMVVTIHDLISIMPKAKQKMGELVFNQASSSFLHSLRFLERNPEYLIITDSISAKLDVVEYTTISPERIFVVPLAHNSNDYYPERDMGELLSMGVATPYILFAGTVDDPRKGVVEILKSFETFASKYNDIKLVLAGDYGHREGWESIKEQLGKTRFTDRIILTGFVSVKQMRNLMSQALVFMFPSEYEGFGLPVLEAMACGAPVITTTASSLPEVGGDAAVYVTPNNPEQLAFEIERLLDSESLRDEHTKKGFKQAGKFSWDKTAEMTEEVFKLAYRS